MLLFLLGYQVTRTWRRLQRLADHRFGAVAFFGAGIALIGLGVVLHQPWLSTVAQVVMLGYLLLVVTNYRRARRELQASYDAAMAEATAAWGRAAEVVAELEHARDTNKQLRDSYLASQMASINAHQVRENTELLARLRN